MKGLTQQKSRTILGNYLRSKRLAADMSQVELGKMLNYSSQFIANWERGASSPPAEVLRKLVRALSIPEQELLDLLYRETQAYLREMVLGKRSQAQSQNTRARAR